MAEPQPLTYDEQKAAEAAFVGAPLNPSWTAPAKLLYARLTAAMQQRGGALSGCVGAADDGTFSRPDR